MKKLIFILSFFILFTIGSESVIAQNTSDYPIYDEIINNQSLDAKDLFEVDYYKSINIDYSYHNYTNTDEEIINKTNILSTYDNYNSGGGDNNDLFNTVIITDSNPDTKDKRIDYSKYSIHNTDYIHIYNQINQ